MIFVICVCLCTTCHLSVRLARWESRGLGQTAYISHCSSTFLFYGDLVSDFRPPSCPRKYYLENPAVRTSVTFMISFDHNYPHKEILSNSYECVLVLFGPPVQIITKAKKYSSRPVNCDLKRLSSCVICPESNSHTHN